MPDSIVTASMARETPSIVQNSCQISYPPAVDEIALVLKLL